jgi:hypothetical protein
VYDGPTVALATDDSGVLYAAASVRHLAVAFFAFFVHFFLLLCDTPCFFSLACQISVNVRSADGAVTRLDWREGLPWNTTTTIAVST